MIYGGFGSGISRALEAQPDIEIINNVEGEQFKVILPRPEEIARQYDSPSQLHTARADKQTIKTKHVKECVLPTAQKEKRTRKSQYMV